jgi:hypothetical protein
VRQSTLLSWLFEMKEWRRWWCLLSVVFFCVVLIFLLVSVLLLCPLFPLVLSPSSSLCLCS